MSSHLHVYIGPHFKVPNVEQEKTVNTYHCSNSECKNHHKMDKLQKFCPECGAQGMIETTKIITKMHATYNFLNSMSDLPEDLMFEPKEGIWLANYRDASINSLSLSEYDTSQDMVITEQNIKDSIEHFEYEHRVVIEAFDKLFQIKLTACYGVVSYYN